MEEYNVEIYLAKKPGPTYPEVNDIY